MTTNANEEIIYAPIEIESADQLHALGATWEDCKTWKFGCEHIKVLLVPADADTRDFLVGELNRRHTRDLRISRCMVPGKLSGLIRCPSQNSCMNCPYGREKEVKQRRELSLESLMEDGFDPEGMDITSDRAEAAVQLELILTRLREEDPRLLDLVYLKAAGYRSREIADRLEISRRTYVRLEQKIREIAESV